jgi:hypothetical protein
MKQSFHTGALRYFIAYSNSTRRHSVWDFARCKEKEEEEFEEDSNGLACRCCVVVDLGVGVNVPAVVAKGDAELAELKAREVGEGLSNLKTLANAS